ncbi:MAG TPA: exopolysaccharide biosynthesis polyprenyl glycosylphosphotransferase [Lachnospiraceae bacterium]|nr:exopolysaccharide biosynthesis polyprenyl glycosylphosphotransferase [Lachnospiraceae bacterium]
MLEMDRNYLKLIYRFVCKIILTVVIILFFALVWTFSLDELRFQAGIWEEKWIMYALYGVVVAICIKAFDGYMIGVNRISTSILSQTLGLILANSIELLILILIIGSNRFVETIVINLLKVLGLQIVFAFLFTWLTGFIYRIKFPPHRILMVYGDYDNNLGAKMCSRDDRYSIVSEMHYSEGLDNIKEEMNKVDAILINDIPSEMRNLILKMCFYADKRVYYTPKLGDIFVRGSEELRVFDTPICFCRNIGLDIGQRIIKRLGDVIVSIIGIIITSPIMLVVAILIKTYDHGSVIYKQDRCTVNGKIFEIIKFRTMREDAEKEGRAQLATMDDYRITPVGRFLRKTRIDELPQFFNVLKGDMSIVGPRPERPEIIQKYLEDIPEFDYRMKVKAGITGYAQVYGKYNTTDLDKLKFDLMYIQKCSILLDIQLMLLTIKVIFIKDAADGIEPPQSP